MTVEFDLLGDPIPENWGKRGRPPHVTTERNCNKIRVLLALGWTNSRIAQALRITGKTLSKHYFRELRQRDEARPAAGAIEPCPRDFAAAPEPRFGAIGRHSPGRGGLIPTSSAF